MVELSGHQFAAVGALVLPVVAVVLLQVVEHREYRRVVRLLEPLDTCDVSDGYRLGGGESSVVPGPPDLDDLLSLRVATMPRSNQLSPVRRFPPAQRTKLLGSHRPGEPKRLGPLAAPKAASLSSATQVVVLPGKIPCRVSRGHPSA